MLPIIKFNFDIDNPDLSFASFDDVVEVTTEFSETYYNDYASLGFGLGNLN